MRALHAGARVALTHDNKSLRCAVLSFQEAELAFGLLLQSRVDMFRAAQDLFSDVECFSSAIFRMKDIIACYIYAPRVTRTSDPSIRWSLHFLFGSQLRRVSPNLVAPC